MKNLILTCLLVIFAIGAQAQDMVQNISMTIFCKEIAVAKEKTNSFLKANPQIIVFRYDEGEEQYGETSQNINMVLSTSAEDATKIELAAAEWGIITKRQAQTVNNSFELEKAEMELEFIVKKKATYEAEIKTTAKDNPSYKEYFAEIQSLEVQIFEAQKKIKTLKNQVQKNSVVIKIMEENSTPSGGNDIRFVNMPGIQYSYLKIENPKNDISSTDYQGVSVKYMFTRGKSFVEIGAFKSGPKVPESDSVRVKELFIYSFGQDFYPTHFGRGSRKFLNLYTGYTVGGIFATGISNSNNTIHITPRVGLELYKSKSVLLDSNVGYFIPFYKNLNLRGIMFNVSFNFLF